MGATRPRNPAARGELLDATERAKIEANQRKTKPTLNTKLRILPKPHCETCVFAGPLLSVLDQCRSDAFAAGFAVGDEHAELSDSIAHEVDVHRPNEHAVDSARISA